MASPNGHIPCCHSASTCVGRAPLLSCACHSLVTQALVARPESALETRSRDTRADEALRNDQLERCGHVVRCRVENRLPHEDGSRRPCFPARGPSLCAIQGG